MPMMYFSIPALRPEPAASDLNHCLATHRVAQVQQQLVADGANSYWAVVVSVLDGEASGPARANGGDAGRRRTGIDYRELLAADEFALYDRLRTARKHAAEADGVPRERRRAAPQTPAPRAGCCSTPHRRSRCCGSRRPAPARCSGSLAHTGTASDRTWLRKASDKALGVSTSTETPSRPCSST